MVIYIKPLQTGLIWRKMWFLILLHFKYRDWCKKYIKYLPRNWSILKIHNFHPIKLIFTAPCLKPALCECQWERMSAQRLRRHTTGHWHGYICLAAVRPLSSPLVFLSVSARSARFALTQNGLYLSQKGACAKFRKDKRRSALEIRHPFGYSGNFINSWVGYFHLVLLWLIG